MQKLPLIFALFCLALCGQYVSAQPSGMSYGVKDAAPISEVADSLNNATSSAEYPQSPGSWIIKDAAPSVSTGDSMSGISGPRGLQVRATVARFFHTVASAIEEFLFDPKPPSLTELVLVVLGVVILVYGHRKKTDRNFTDVIVLTDPSVTEGSLPVEPDAILRLLRLNGRNTRATYRINAITGKTVSNAMECYIYKETKNSCVGETTQSRSDSVHRFFENVTAITFSHQKAVAAIPYPAGEIYFAIAADLNIFSSGSAGRQILIVHSNLHEESSIFSWKCGQDLERLYSNPQEVAARFARAEKIGRLNGVHVRFVCNPESNELRFFNAMVRAYGYILIPLGARVSVQFNAKNYDL